jgi:hypothetical protein
MGQVLLRDSFLHNLFGACDAPHLCIFCRLSCIEVVRDIFAALTTRLKA